MISDLINSITDSFGEQAFVKESLKKYYLKTKSDNKKTTGLLLTHHWNYLSEELFNETHQYISNKPLIKKTDLFVYDKNYKERGFYNDTKWGLLLRFLSKTNIKEDTFKRAVLLIFEYVRREPGLYNSLVYQIKTSTKKAIEIFRMLFFYLFENKDDLLCKSLFIEFANLFLDHSHLGSMKENRKIIWDMLFYYFDTDKEQIERNIIAYLNNRHIYPFEVLNFDLEILVPFLEANYAPSNFRMTYWLINFFKQERQYEKIRLQYKNIIKKYETEEYRLYNLLNWNKLGNKNKIECKNGLNYRAYDKVKTDEILKKISINTDKDFEPIIRTIKNSYLIEPDNNEYPIPHRSISIILSNVMKENLARGIKLTNKTLNQFPKIKNIAHLPVNHIKTENDFSKVWEYIEKLDGTFQKETKLYLFAIIPNDFLNKKYADDFLDLCKISIADAVFYFKIAEKFLRFEPNLYDILLNLILSHNMNGNAIEIDDHDVEEYIIEKISNTNNLITFYFQQKELNHSFDNFHRIFAKIFFVNKQFLIEYIKFLNQNRDYHDKLFSSECLASIWNDPEIENLINTLFSIYKADFENALNIQHWPLNVELLLPLFSELNDEQYDKALKFLLLKLDKEKDSEDMVNLILSIARQMGKDTFTMILHRYLDYRCDLESFKALQLFPRSAQLSGFGTFGDIYADRWAKVIDILKKYPDQFKVIPLITYAENEREEYLKHADSEKENDYMGYR